MGGLATVLMEYSTPIDKPVPCNILIILVSHHDRCTRTVTQISRSESPTNRYYEILRSVPNLVTLEDQGQKT